MPQLAWREEDMRYTLLFFPCVGAVIGALAVGWYALCDRVYGTEGVTYAAIGCAIPLIVTGGFHADGFLDTVDALHSYGDREKKLAILKDPHVGAFAVIFAGLCGLIWLGAYAQVRSLTQSCLLGVGYVLSRTLSAIGVVTLRPARKDGLLVAFAGSAHRTVVLAGLFAELLVCAAALLLLSPSAGGLVCAGAFAVFFGYRRMSRRAFGGISGDTAGWFVTVCESVTVVLCAVAGAWG